MRNDNVVSRFLPYLSNQKTITIRMAKTKQQLQALDYAMDYLELLLKMEDTLGDSLNQRIDQAVRKYMESNHKHI